jgi:uncharacterized protein YciI
MMKRILPGILLALIYSCACAQKVTPPSGSEYAIILHVMPRYQADSVWTDEDKAAVGAHFAALQKLQKEGKLVFAGRTINTASTGFIILKNMTEAEARNVLAEDKAVQRGIMRAEFQPFQTALKEK